MAMVGGERSIIYEGLARGSMLGQLAPSNTTAVALVTAMVRTEITALFIANTTGTAALARVFHDEGGSTYAASNALYYDISIAANSTTVIAAQAPFGGIVLAKDDTLGVRTATTNALTFTAYGTRETR